MEALEIFYEKHQLELEKLVTVCTDDCLSWLVIMLVPFVCSRRP
jgi:hypothetical protein